MPVNFKDITGLFPHNKFRISLYLISFYSIKHSKQYSLHLNIYSLHNVVYLFSKYLLTFIYKFKELYIRKFSAFNVVIYFLNSKRNVLTKLKIFQIFEKYFTAPTAAGFFDDSRHFALQETFLCNEIWFGRTFPSIFNESSDKRKSDFFLLETHGDETSPFYDDVAIFFLIA